MLLQSIRPYYLQNFAAAERSYKQKRTTQNQNFQNTQLTSYPSNYYLPVSFGRQLTHLEIIDKIGRENFPSPVIAESFEEEKDKSLYEVHKEYYSDLLDCKTLEEAKEKYPEFEDVIDAKDVNLDKFRSHHPLKKIKEGKISGVSLNNLSLELLKKQYAEVKSTKSPEHYFNIRTNTADKIFEMLKIKKLNRIYYYALTGSSPEFKEHNKIAAARTWQQDDGTRRTAVSDRMQSAWADASKREVLSVSIKRSWDADDGTRRGQARHHATTILQTPEAKAKAKKTRNTDEYRQKFQKIIDSDEYKKAHAAGIETFRKSGQGKLYAEAREEAYQRHPEITEIMSKIAKEFPMLGRILNKTARGWKLTETEELIRKTYLKRCSEEMPDYQKIIGEEFHRILVEWGLKEE